MNERQLYRAILAAKRAQGLRCLPQRDEPGFAAFAEEVNRRGRRLDA